MNCGEHAGATWWWWCYITCGCVVAKHVVATWYGDATLHGLACCDGMVGTVAFHRRRDIQPMKDLHAR